jgi:hypothetical protein
MQITDSLDYGAGLTDQWLPKPEKPLAIRGYLTRTALAHKLKLISGTELEKKFVGGTLTDVKPHEIMK